MLLHLAIEYLDVGARDGSGISHVPVDTTAETEVAREWVESPPEWVAGSIKKGHLLTARRDSSEGSIVLCSRATQVYKTRGPSLTTIDGDRVTRRGRPVMTYEFGAPRVAAACAESMTFGERADVVARWGYDWRLAWSRNNNLDYLLRVAHDVIGFSSSTRRAIAQISELWIKMLGSDEASRLADPYIGQMSSHVAVPLTQHEAQLRLSELHKIQHGRETPGVTRMVAQVLQSMYRSVSTPHGMLSLGQTLTGALSPDPSYEDAACELVRSHISLADVMVASLAAGQK